MADAVRRDVISWSQVLAGLGCVIVVAALIDYRVRHRRTPEPGRRLFAEAGLGEPYLIELQGVADGPRHRFRLRVAADGLHFEATGKATGSSTVPATEIWSVHVAHHRFELRRTAGATPEVMTLGDDDRERFAWELAYRFPEAMERGLAC